MCRVLFAILGMLLIVLASVEFYQRRLIEEIAPVQPARVTTSATPREPPPEVQYDPDLLIPREAFVKALAVADVPITTDTLPLADMYWDKNAEAVLLEPEPAEILVQEVGDLFWFTWASNDCILCADRHRIYSVDIRTRRPRSIFYAYKIDQVYPSPDRRRLAVHVANEMFILDASTGEPLGRVRLKVPIIDAAWHPDSRRLAFSTRDAVWLVEPGSPSRMLARHPRMKNEWSNPEEWRPVYSTDDLSWSVSGRYLAYRVHIMSDDRYPQSMPYIQVYDTHTGRGKQVSSGYSERDCWYSWLPVDDWIIEGNSGGDVDDSIFLTQAWGDGGMPLECLGSTSAHQQTSWRPGSNCYATNVYDFGASPRMGWVSGLTSSPRFIRLDVIDPSRRRTGVEGKNWETYVALSKMLQGAPSMRLHDRRIPEFDWSPDGSMYAYAETLYTFRQWDEKAPGFELDSSPFMLLEAFIVHGCVRLPVNIASFAEKPEFSPDGEWLGFISQAKGKTCIMRCRMSIVTRSNSEAMRWFREGQAQLRAGNQPEAAAALRNSVRHAPGWPGAHSMLSDLYVRLARNEQNPYMKHELLRAAALEAKHSGNEGAEIAERINAHVNRIRETALSIKPGTPALIVAS